MKKYLLILIASYCVFSSLTSSASALESIIVWTPSVGTERTNTDAVVSFLSAEGATNQTVDFSLVAGEGDADNASFDIVGHELRSAHSLPVKNYSIRLRAMTGSGLSVEKELSIQVIPGKVAPKVAAGRQHTVVLSSDGSLFTFGSEETHGTTTPLLAPTLLEHENLDGHVIVDIAAGSHHTVLLSADGTVFTFGFSFGQLGHGDMESRFVPTPLEHENIAGHSIVQIAARGMQTLLLSREGTVFNFGRSWGLSFPSFYHLVPTPIEPENLLGHTITSVAAGGNHGVLLASDGTTFTFGQDRLGDEPNEAFLTPRPVEHPNLAGHRVAAIAAGPIHTVLLSSDGTVFTFGLGHLGALGHGDYADRSAPTPIANPNLAGINITGIFAGWVHTVLLGSNGEVYTFGDGPDGQLGHGNTARRNIPMRIEKDQLSGHSISGIAADAGHAVFLSANGAVLTFGSGGQGQLGHGDDANQLSPLAIRDFNLAGKRTLRVRTVGAGSSSVLVNGETLAGPPYLYAAEKGSTVSVEIVPDDRVFFDRWLDAPEETTGLRNVALDTDHELIPVLGKESVIVWERKIPFERTGVGAFISPLHSPGQADEMFDFSLTAGTGDRDNGSFSVDGNWLKSADTLPPGEYRIRLEAMTQEGRSVEEEVKISVFGDTVVPEMDGGDNHTVMSSSDGRVFTFGSGRLGHGDSTRRDVPTLIEHDSLAGYTIAQVAAGADHTVLLATNGTVFTFGSGENGRLGLGDTSARHVPTRLVHENLEGHTIVKIAAGSAHTVLLSADGTVFTFGASGESTSPLGHQELGDRLSPTAIEAETLTGHFITEIAAGAAHTVLLASDGTVFTFGAGGDGRLGHGDVSQRRIPVAIETDQLAGRTITGIAAGNGHTVLLAEGGAVYTFGSGAVGALGHGDTLDRLIPARIDDSVVAGKVIREIAAGRRHTVLLAEDGTVFTFGWGNSGQLGNGDIDNRLLPSPVPAENFPGQVITGIGSGARHTLLYSADGAVFSFGNGGDGQLGHGDLLSQQTPLVIDDFNVMGMRILRLTAIGAGQGTFYVDGEPFSGPPYLHVAEVGTEITLEASPAMNSFLDHWRGDITGGSLVHTITLDQDIDITAVLGEEFLHVWNTVIGTDRTGSGALVSPVYAAGPAGETFGFSVVPGQGDSDNDRFKVTDNQLRTTEILPPGDYSVRLHAANGSGISVEKPFSIRVVPDAVEPDIAAGAVTILLNSSGSLLSFGSGSSGALGHGDKIDRFVATPIEHENLSGHNIARIAAGGAHTVLLSMDGVVHTFGSGSITQEGKGQLGHGDIADRLVPTPIEHANLFDHAIVDIVAGYDHTVLLSADGTVFTFGGNIFGKLGHGDSEDRLVPTPVTHENLAGHTILGLAAGKSHTILLAADGTVFRIGSSHFGDHPSVNVPTPINKEALAGHRIIRVVAGHSQTILHSSEGAVLTFGLFKETLGLGGEAPKSAPALVDHENLEGQFIVDSAGGPSHSVILSENGTVFTFGIGTSGRLGHGDADSRLFPTPVQHPNLEGHQVTRVAAGRSRTVLLAQDGTLFTFGRGVSGQLGHGDTADRVVPTPVPNLNLRNTSIEAARFFATLGEAGLAGATADPAGVSSGDGVQNLLKYAFNMDLNGPDRRMLTPGGAETAGLPVIHYDDSDTGSKLVIEYVRQKNSGLIYSPEISHDLVNWHPVGTTSQVTDLDTGWERVVVEIPTDQQTEGAFGRVQVTLP